MLRWKEGMHNQYGIKLRRRRNRFEYVLVKLIEDYSSYLWRIYVKKREICWEEKNYWKMLQWFSDESMIVDVFLLKYGKALKLVFQIKLGCYIVFFSFVYSCD